MPGGQPHRPPPAVLRCSSGRTDAMPSIERHASRVAGRGVPKQRTLHFLTQYLHLEGRHLCRRVFSGANRQVAYCVLSAYLSRTPAKVP
jgi:hypothetical protein